MRAREEEGEGDSAGKATTAEELTMVAVAVRQLEFYEDANEVLGEATEKDKTYAPALVAWGELFAEKYNAADMDCSGDVRLSDFARFAILWLTTCD